MSEKIQWIDAAKGCAMFGVIGIHVAQSVKDLPQNLYIKLICAVMPLGVQLFFIISAYVTCLSYEKYQNGSWKVFVLRRYIRLVPVYVLGIVVYGSWTILAATLGWPQPFGSVASCSSWNVFLNATLINTFFPSAQNSIVPGGWSISCIAFFYMTFPWMYRAMSEAKTIRIVVMLIVNLVIVLLMWFQTDLSKEFIYFSAINQLIVFVVGMLMFFKPLMMEWFKRMSYAGLGLMLMLTLLSSGMMSKLLGYSFLYRHIVICFFFIPLLAILQKMGEGLPLALLKFGRKSYSIFIVSWFTVNWTDALFC